MNGMIDVVRRRRGSGMTRIDRRDRRRAAHRRPASPCAAATARSRDGRCRRAAGRRADPQQPADHAQPFRAIARHRRFAAGARRDADRRVVEAHHQDVALDAAGRQPVARAARAAPPTISKLPSRVAHDLLAGEAVPVDRVGDQAALRIVERQRPVARLRGRAADQHVAAAVERAAGIVAAREEGDAVARADRQFAAARDRGARIGVDVGGAGLRPGGPAPIVSAPNAIAARQRKPRRAEADRRPRASQRETMIPNKQTARHRSDSTVT